jgi:hypothetical protein
MTTGFLGESDGLSFLMQFPYPVVCQPEQGLWIIVVTHRNLSLLDFDRFQRIG